MTIKVQIEGGTFAAIVLALAVIYRSSVTKALACLHNRRKRSNEEIDGEVQKR